MERIEVDFAVIGSGPAGQKSAIQAAKLGASCLMIEQYPKLGGGCLHSGTIPSKALREAILDLGSFSSQRFYANRNVKVSAEQITLDALNQRLAKILEDESSIIERQFVKNGIQVLCGKARFLSPNTLFVEGQVPCEVVAKKILIATGSSPRNPVEVPFDQETIFDSTRLLNMPEIPKRLIVLGAGIVGTEYASFFSVLGTEVILVDKQPQLMQWLDSEISSHLTRCLQELDLVFLANAKPKKIWSEKKEGDKKVAFVELEDGAVLEADAVLYALGRGAQTQSLALDKAGVELDEKGFISVDANYQTNVKHIYAAGDVVGPPALAATSMEQGRCAAYHGFCKQDKKRQRKLYQGGIGVSPIGIYTIPEISSIGCSEEQLIKKGTSYEVGRAYYYELARARICGERSGLFKVLFCPDTMKILGLHIIGRGATEVIHIGQLAMELGATLDFFVDHTFNYPTYAEGYRIAALNGLNKIR